MFGEDHLVWNLPRNARHKMSSMWLEKNKHVWVKTTVNLYFYEVAKIKHVWLLSNTYQIQGVWKKTHIFVKKTNMCVFSHTGGDTFCICTCIFDT